MKRLVVLATREPRRSESWDVKHALRGLHAINADAVHEAHPDRDVLFVPHAVAEPQPDRSDLLALPTVSVVTSARWLQSQTAWPPATAEVPEHDLVAEGDVPVGWIRRSVLSLASGADVATTLQHLLSDAADRITPCFLPTAEQAVPAHGRVATAGRIVVLAEVHPSAVLPQILQGYLIAGARGADLPPLAVVGPGAGDVGGSLGLGSLFGVSAPDQIIGLEALTEAERTRALEDAAAIVVGTPEVGLGRDIRDAVVAGVPALVPASMGHAPLLHRLSAWARPFDPYDALAVADALGALFGPDHERYVAAAHAGRHGAAVASRGTDGIRAVLVDVLGDGTPPERSAGPAAQARGVPNRLRVAVVVRSAPSVGGVRFLESVIGPARDQVDATLVLSRAAARSIGDALPEVPRIPYSRAGLDAVNADVVWVPWPHLSMPPRTDAPLTCTWHDFNYLHTFGDGAESTWSESHRLREARIATLWFGRCENVIHSAEAIRTEMQENFPGYAEKSRVVPVAAPALPHAERGDEVRARFGLTGPFLLTPNGYYPHKNQDMLIRALALAHAEGDELTVVFTGNITWELDGRAPGAIGLGMVTDSDLAALYALARGVVIPSLYEAGSYAMIEALHAGVPVAAADRPAPVEIANRLGGDVLFFNPEDPRAALQAMRALMAGNAIPHVTGTDEGRTQADVAAEYLAVWREAVAGHGERAIAS